MSLAGACPWSFTNRHLTMSTQSNVPARYPANKKLGIWVSAQRQQKKLLDSNPDAKPNKSTPLTPERIKLLDDLGFTWTIRSRDSLGDTWFLRLEELRAYQREHGNCLVPSRYQPNPELGIWVGTQRTQYRLYMKAKESGKPSNSAMNEDRIAHLDQIGFVSEKNICCRYHHFQLLSTHLFRQYFFP